MADLRSGVWLDYVFRGFPGALETPKFQLAAVATVY